MTGDAKAILLLVLLVLTACADEGPRFNQVSAGLPPPPANSALGGAFEAKELIRSPGRGAPLRSATPR